MGLAQIINCEYTPQELDELLLSLRYEKYADRYILKTANCSIEIKLSDKEIFIHKSGDYYYYFGMLIERLGEITDILEISDQ